MQSKGFISASVDSVFFDSTAAILKLFLGESYRWAMLHIDSVEKEILTAISWNRNDFENKPLRIDQMQAMQRTILDHLENNGYPFANITLDSIRLEQGMFEAQLKIEKGPLYKIDSIRNMGTASISDRYLQRYLNILNGSLYKKTNLLAISRKINELPFVTEQQPWSITWLGTGSIINLNLDPRKSSQVNVLVGLLPAVATSNNIYEVPRTKLQFTGEATINLRNSLGNGELIGLNWQQIQLKSPRLNLAYQQSYLFGSPFGVNFAFDLFKKDTSFITINMMLGAQYAVSSSQSGSLFIQNQQSNLITVDTNFVKQNRLLPLEADMRSVSLGIQYEGYTTNYRFNPTKGNEWQLMVSAGTKKIKKNSVIVQLTDKTDPGFNFNSLYDTIRLKSFQFRIKGSAAHYFPISKVSTIRAAVTVAWFQSPSIFRNELFQIGGYKLLRGFDEESIYASQFAVATAEYRYLIDRNSYLFTFADFGWTRSTATSVIQKNTFLGAGLGMALETKAGIFNISYAVGKRNDLNFNLRQSKIHFGYVNFF
ncbi:MAG: hypothetical protein ACKVOW_01835 [Chitinophagaceae bacterium]